MKNTQYFSLSLCRGEDQLEEGEDAVYVDLAVRSGLGSVPNSGLGPVRAGALRPVLFARLGTNEARGLLVCRLSVLREPARAECHHHFLLLRHRHEALLHLQEVDQQQPRPQHHQTPPEASDSKSLRADTAVTDSASLSKVKPLCVLKLFVLL